MKTNKLEQFRATRDNKRLGDASTAELVWALSEQRDDDLYNAIRYSDELREKTTPCEEEGLNEYTFNDGSIAYIDNDNHVWTENEWYIS